jgi:predicted DNA-binding transcriptional regulator AlpA
MTDDAGDRLITIDQFTEMVGFGRQWYYKHHSDPSMPQRVYVEGRPKLSLKECNAYIEAVKRARPPRPGRRKRGRPSKADQAARAAAMAAASPKQ